MKINITWTTDDIWDVAEEHDITLNEEQCVAIIRRLGDCHDATVGINWDVILDTIRSYLTQTQQ